MAIPNNPIVAAISNWSFRRLVPILGQLFKSREAYTYLPESTQLFMTREQLKSSMGICGIQRLFDIKIFEWATSVFTGGQSHEVWNVCTSRVTGENLVQIAADVQDVETFRSRTSSVHPSRWFKNHCGTRLTQVANAYVQRF